jgi:hypothetical protein
VAETAEQTPQTVDGGGDRAHTVATIVMFAFLLASIAAVAYSLAEHGVGH